MPILLYGAENWMLANWSASCQTRILPGRTWKENPKVVGIYCKIRLPSSLYAGSLWRQESYAGSWASWGKLEPKRASYLPASYVPLPQRIYWMYLSSSSASSWKPILAQTSPCPSVKPSLNHLKPNPYQIQQGNCSKSILPTSWPELTPTLPYQCCHTG